MERVLWNDPATGVMRHADAGYEIAVAKRDASNGLKLPMFNREQIPFDAELVEARAHSPSTGSGRTAWCMTEQETLFPGELTFAQLRRL